MPTYLYFDDTTRHGAMLRGLLRTLESGDDQFTDVRSVMIQMLEGQDGSADAHYAPHVKFFKFGGYDPTQGDPSAAQLAIAHAAFSGLDSAYSKTSGDGTVANVRAARDQLFAKLR